MIECNKAPDQACIDEVLFCGVKGSAELLKTLLKMLYKEGREFARTEDSACWQMWLRDLELYKAASVLWSISNMDSFVQSGRDPELEVDDLLGF
ncbi:MAG: hypothetical protein ACP5JJ_14040 [Anaerolineae bacterium]